MAQEFAEKLSYNHLQSLYDNEELYALTDRKWLKRCVLCLAVITPFDVGYHLNCCRTSYVHEACRSGPSNGNRQGDRTLGATNRKAGKRIRCRQVTFNGKSCPSCRKPDAQLVKFTDHMQYMDKMSVKCPIQDCNRLMTAVDLLQHYATCSGESWLAVTTDVVRKSRRTTQERPELEENVVDLTDWGEEYVGGVDSDNELEIDNDRLRHILVGLDEPHFENTDSEMENELGQLDDELDRNEISGDEGELDQEIDSAAEFEDDASAETDNRPSEIVAHEDLDELMRLVHMCRNGHAPLFDENEDNEDRRLAWHLQRREVDTLDDAEPVMV